MSYRNDPRPEELILTPYTDDEAPTVPGEVSKVFESVRPPDHTATATEVPVVFEADRPTAFDGLGTRAARQISAFGHEAFATVRAYSIFEAFTLGVRVTMYLVMIGYLSSELALYYSLGGFEGVFFLSLPIQFGIGLALETSAFDRWRRSRGFVWRN